MFSFKNCTPTQLACSLAWIFRVKGCKMGREEEKEGLREVRLTEATMQVWVEEFSDTKNLKWEELLSSQRGIDGNREWNKINQSGVRKRKVSNKDKKTWSHWKDMYRGFLSSPVVRLHFKAGHVSSIPGWGAKISHVSVQKQTNKKNYPKHKTEAIL